MSNFSGSLVICNWSGKTISHRLMRDGKQYKKIQPNKLLIATTNNASSNSSTSSCPDVEVCLWEQKCVETYQGDVLIGVDCETWVLIGCEMMPDPDCEEPDPCEGLTPEECACQMYGIGCDDDGGGGGDGDGGEVESVQIQAISDEPEVSYGTEEVDLSTGEIHWNASYEWRCGTGQSQFLGNIFNWSYYSYETGALKKMNTNDTWKFETLEHNSIQRIGTTSPTSIYSESLGNAVSNIAPNMRTARMDVNFVVYRQVIQTGSVRSWEVRSFVICKAP